uniref:Uncharacterized protein n=1 Tax=Setaria viridis TaxID=4556 RepID=A0A4U6V8X0_SETVI|nr:hypothetical protein SEVIR_4G291500v2 [Setaria viridis]
MALENYDLFLYFGLGSVANLWDVSDKDIDRFSKALLHSWLREDSADDSNCSQCSQLTQESESINIGVEGNDRRDVDTKRCSCRQRRVSFKSK